MRLIPLRLCLRLRSSERKPGLGISNRPSLLLPSLMLFSPCKRNLKRQSDPLDALYASVMTGMIVLRLCLRLHLKTMQALFSLSKITGSFK